MKTFQYIQRAIPERTDLKTIAETASVLEKGHQDAIIKESELKNAISELPLNEAEDGYKDELLNTFENVINDNIKFGNHYYALSDINKFAGDIMSSKRMRSKLNAQKEYKEFEDMINKTNLPAIYKEMYLDIGKYENNEQINPETGEVTKYTTWEKPNLIPTNLSNLPELQVRAYQLAAREKGSYDSIYYKDANGEYTTNRDASPDKIPYYKEDAKFEELPKENVEKILRQLINDTPGARESLYQDYKLGEWIHNRNRDNDPNNDRPIVINDMTSSDGLLLNFEEYINKKVTGFADTVFYDHRYRDTTLLDGLRAVGGGNVSTSRSNNVSVKNNFEKISGFTIIGESYIPKESAISSSIGMKNAAASAILDYARDSGVNIDDSQNIFAICDNIKKLNGGKLPKNIYDALLKYKQSVRDYEQLVPDDPDYKERVDFITALEHSSDLTTFKKKNENGEEVYGNKYVSKYINLVDRLFKDKEEIRLPLSGIKNETELSYILPNYKDLGITMESKNIIIPKSAISNLYNIFSSISPYYEGSYKKFNDKLLGTYATIVNEIKPFMNLYNESFEYVKEIVNENTTIIIPNIVTQSDVVNDYVLTKYPNATKDEINYLQKTINDNIDRGLQLVSGSNTTMGIGYTGDSNKQINYDNTGTQRNAAVALYNYIKSIKPDYTSIGYDDQTTEQQITIVLPNNTDDIVKKFKESMDIDGDISKVTIRGSFISSELKNEFMSLPSFKYNSELARIVNSNIPNTDLIVNGNNNESYSLINENGQFYISDLTGSKTPITNNQVGNALKARDLYNDLIYYFDNINFSDPNSYYPYIENLIFIANILHPNIETIYDSENNITKPNYKLLFPYMKFIHNNISKINNKNIKFNFSENNDNVSFEFIQNNTNVNEQ